MTAADAVEEERQRLASIFRDLANDCAATARALPETRGRARSILDIQERAWREAVLIVLGEHTGYPRPVPDIGVEPGALVQSSRDFQYIGTARSSVRIGEKVGVWLNEAGAVWALSQIGDAQ